MTIPYICFVVAWLLYTGETTMRLEYIAAGDKTACEKSFVEMSKDTPERKVVAISQMTPVPPALVTVPNPLGPNAENALMNAATSAAMPAPLPPKLKPKR